MGAPAFDTAKYYELFNLSAENEMPDAVHLQLDFAVFLLKLMEETPYVEDKRKLSVLYKDFFKKHILWMEDFADCILENTSIEPLKEFARLFKEFLQREKERLKL